MNRAWYLTPESFKRSVKIEDDLDDETIKTVIGAASDVMPRQFFVQTRTITVRVTHPDHVLLNGLDLLSVTSIETNAGRDSWRAWSTADYILEPDEAPYQTPPRPYWKISRVPGGSWRFPCHGDGWFSGQARMRITGRWGFYDVRKLLPVTLRAPDTDSEVQLLTPGGTISGGSFTLRFGVDETVPIAWNATALDIQTALEGLASIGAGNIVGGGGPINTTPVTLTFQAALANADVSQIIIDDNDLTGVAPTLVASTFHQGSAGTGTIDASTTAITVSAAGIVETGHTLHIGDEDMFVEAVDGADLTVERGINGSTAASHVDGAAIELYTYPIVEQACLILAQRWVRRTKDAPYGIVGSIDGFMRLAINDPDVVTLLRFAQ